MIEYIPKTAPFAHQAEALRLQGDKPFFALPMDMGTGKAAPVSEPVLTPSGFVPIGSIAVGDLVVGSNGLPCRVLGVYPQVGTRVYRVDFKDGGFARCSPEHLWAARTNNDRANKKPYRIVTTEEMLRSGLEESRGYKWSIPLVSPVQFPAKSLLVDPYFLGVVLGDGSIDKYGDVMLCTDEEILQQWPGKDYDHTTPGINNRRIKVFRQELVALGLGGLRSWEKIIPTEYLLAGVEQRLALLQGLLDTDGTPNRTGGSVFTSTSEGLADGVVWLAQSLGGLASKKGPYIPRHQGGLGRPAWDVNVRLPGGGVPFRLARKAAKFVPATKYLPLRKIKAIYPVEDEQCVCIKVDAPDELYVTRHFVVTHNTKIIIDTAARLYEQGKINALVVVAPNGVSRQWVEEQIPAHLPDRIPRLAAAWYATPKVAQKKAWEIARDTISQGLHILTFHYEAISTDRGKKELWKILERFEAMLVLDESHRAKSPNAKVTKSLLAASRRAKYRRILSGTPFDNSPLDAYAQFRFLSESIFRFPSFAAFRARYAQMAKHCGRCHFTLDDPTPEHCPNCFAEIGKPVVYRGGKPVEKPATYDTVVAFRRLDELRDIMEPHYYRVRKDTVLDLPPKVYETREVVLTPVQKKHYASLLAEGVALLGHATRDPEQDIFDLMLDKTVDKVVAKTALTNMLRRRQVLCGFLEEAGEIRWLDEKNPRIKALLDVLQDIDGKVLIWGAFRQDMLEILSALPRDSAVAYYGDIDQETRALNKQRFIEDPECRYFVGTAAAGGTGVDGLTVANTVIYYSNTLRAGDRWQSEDRAHRIGQRKSVTYIDLIAPGTLDEKLVEMFVTKRTQAEFLLGDT